MDLFLIRYIENATEYIPIFTNTKTKTKTKKLIIDIIIMIIII